LCRQGEAAGLEVGARLVGVKTDTSATHPTSPTLKLRSPAGQVVERNIFM
jgi:hypothetical protein